jgi:hypothetical protein
MPMQIGQLSSRFILLHNAFLKSAQQQNDTTWSVPPSALTNRFPKGMQSTECKRRLAAPFISRNLGKTVEATPATTFCADNRK